MITEVLVTAEDGEVKKANLFMCDHCRSVEFYAFQLIELSDDGAKGDGTQEYYTKEDVVNMVECMNLDAGIKIRSIVAKRIKVDRSHLHLQCLRCSVSYCTAGVCKL